MYDALDPLRRLSPNAPADIYHNPHELNRTSKEPYNPRNTLLKGAITKNGGDSYHSSGTRKHTARELALFQSFPYGYKFEGPQTKAKEQIGNAFPPVMAAAMYRTIAQTLEAYDHGFIDAEDDVCDIDTALELMDIQIPGSEGTPIDLLNPDPNPVRSKYKYLTRSPEASRPQTPTSAKRRTVFGRGTDIEPERERERKRSKKKEKHRAKARSSFDLLGEGSPSPSPSSRRYMPYQPKKSALDDEEFTEAERLWLAKEEELRVAKENGDFMELE